MLTRIEYVAEPGDLVFDTRGGSVERKNVVKVENESLLLCRNGNEADVTGWVDLCDIKWCPINTAWMLEDKE